MAAGAEVVAITFFMSVSVIKSCKAKLGISFDTGSFVFPTFVPRMRTFNEHILPNGLRIVHEASPTGVVYCGYVVMAGTRHEDVPDSGMAHFCEHLTFKGTRRRRACHIANGLERVGGDLNAYTSKQETVYYATVLRGDFARAVDLLSDIVFHSVYPQREIDREVDVIADEIDSYNDSPAELIYDEFESMVFAGHPLGRDILGDAARLRQYTTADARRFTGRYYRPSNVVFYCYGQVDFARVVRTVERATAGLEPGFEAASPQPLPEYRPEVRRVPRGTHQTHVLVGGRAFGGSDDRHVGLVLLNNLMAGPGMNARLNTVLRERAGLVYTVEGSLLTYPDAGAWCVYFGCDEADVTRCCRLVSREYARLVESPLSPARLAAAKKQLKGQIGIGCDSFENYALALGKTYAHYGRPRDVERLFARIDSLTVSDLQAIAQAAFPPERMTTLIYTR